MWTYGIKCVLWTQSWKQKCTGRHGELLRSFLCTLTVCALQVIWSCTKSLISSPRLGRWHQRGKENILSTTTGTWLDVDSRVCRLGLLIKEGTSLSLSLRSKLQWRGKHLVDIHVHKPVPCMFISPASCRRHTPGMFFFFTLENGKRATSCGWCINWREHVFPLSQIFHNKIKSAELHADIWDILNP